MKFENLTIVISTKNEKHLDMFIEQNFELLKDNILIVIDSGGGEKLRPYCSLYLNERLSFWEARKLAYKHVTTKFVLNLDSDNVPPLDYVRQAMDLLRHDKAEAVAIDYEKPLGHPAFGTSLWKIECLRQLYDFPPQNTDVAVKVGFQTWLITSENENCECTYMWRKLKLSGGRLETLPFRAKHLKP